MARAERRGYPHGPGRAAGPGPSAGPGDGGLRWQRPSPRLLRARRIQAGLVTGPAALAGGLIAGAAGSAALGPGIGPGLVVAGLPGERFLARRVAAWGYAGRRDDPDGPARGHDPAPAGHPVRADAGHRRHRRPGGAEPAAWPACASRTRSRFASGCWPWPGRPGSRRRPPLPGRRRWPALPARLVRLEDPEGCCSGSIPGAWPAPSR